VEHIGNEASDWGVQKVGSSTRWQRFMLPLLQKEMPNA